MKSSSPSQIETLDIFIEHAKELLQSSFLKQAKKKGISTAWVIKDGHVIIPERTGPKHESVKALILTLRLFCQDNDVLSLKRMSKMITELPNIDGELKSEFEISRENFNKYLDASPPEWAAHLDKNCPPKNRDILETFLYGSFAHKNIKKRQIVKEWQKDLFFVDLRAHFDTILLNFISTVAAMLNVCKQIRKQIVSKTTLRKGTGADPQ